MIITDRACHYIIFLLLVPFRFHLIDHLAWYIHSIRLFDSLGPCWGACSVASVFRASAWDPVVLRAYRTCARPCCDALSATQLTCGLQSWVQWVCVRRPVIQQPSGREGNLGRAQSAGCWTAGSGAGICSSLQH